MSQKALYEDATCMWCTGEACALCDITGGYCEHDVIDRHGDRQCADDDEVRGNG